MLFEKDPKFQLDPPPVPDGQPADVIVSPDTRRENRIPPGQSRTRKWPVLDASGTPAMDLDAWQLSVWGLVGNPIAVSLQQLFELPKVKVFADFHCVTRWSRLGNLWLGVSTREILAQAGGLSGGATHVLAHGYDRGWTANIPVEEFLAEDALLAISHDGEPLSLDHGGPVRLMIPRLYAWKSAKWLCGLEFLPHDKAGFWEANGYHMHGNPWNEERYGY
ncbi:MAG: sulfite oxidase-like oxidoreductase [Bryobacterales bacterium]|nr:sulfite oxidase-like oxidoreductase [Bryobacterales bacterium]